MNFIISIGARKQMYGIPDLPDGGEISASTEPYRVFVVDKEANCGNTNRCRNTIGSYHNLRKGLEGQPYAEPSLQECAWCLRIPSMKSCG